MKKLLVLTVASLVLGFSSLAKAEEVDHDYKIVIKDHMFVPARLEIPTGKKVKILVDNQDATPEEFESYELNREKIISGNSSAIVFVGPLEAGDYKFFGEFNQETAQGVIVATDTPSSSPQE